MFGKLNFSCSAFGRFFHWFLHNYSLLGWRYFKKYNVTSSGDFKPEVGIIISKINNNSALSGILLDLREFDALNFHSVKWEKNIKG